MRVIGYLDRPGLKVTVFKMDTRLSIKFENGQAEQTYKFRINDQINNLAAIDQLVDEAFLHSVRERFVAMQSDFQTAFLKVAPPITEDDLPEII